ncbi:unnamed protein product [Vicia faba]|uniref:Uncharacterized protein n=1 Tax=Vicia faba TaxID=3906 RepID=A0AAV0ZBX7_VICFA|nr:unnamed protein product [Vicia faba]
MGPVHGERNGSSSHLSPQTPKLNRKRGTLQKGGNCFAPDCDSPLDTLLQLWREEDKKTRSVLLVSQLIASKGCPLSAGCWSSLLRGSRLSFTGLLSACAKEQENGCAKVDARPKQATASPYQRKPWSSALARFTWRFAHPLAGRGANATRLVGEG